MKKIIVLTVCMLCAIQMQAGEKGKLYGAKQRNKY
jgi:hypothetical protein